jgi:LuxR family transcriptional regulator, maltose regulon positive regulatory protein
MSEPHSASLHSINHLLNTKLMPPRLVPAVIQRAKLLTRLDEGLTKKLTLVSAPTGFGKTTLVGMWLLAETRPAPG